MYRLHRIGEWKVPQADLQRIAEWLEEHTLHYEVIAPKNHHPTVHVFSDEPSERNAFWLIDATAEAGLL